MGTSACVCFRTRQSHTDTRLFGRLVHVLDHIVVVRFKILSTIIMADEELDSFARLNVASEQVFSLARDAEFGRFVVANKDLGVGDTVMEERPLSWAPMLDSPPICLNCAKFLQKKSYRCPVCGWPMCNSKCAKAAVHRDQECRVFKEKGRKVDCSDWDFEEPQALYTVVTVLRVLGLKEKDAKVSASMESHLVLWKKRPEFAKYSQTVSYIRDFLGVKADESKILSIIASSFTNDFSHRDPGAFGELHLMFPLTAMLNHSCFPNIARSVRREADGGFLMRVVAARPIKKGEQIFNCYTDMLDPVQVRSAALVEGKNMQCRCVRCEDPRDLGSLGNALLCPVPSCRGCMLPSSPKDETWTCEKCGKGKPAAQVNSLILQLEREQKSLLGDPAKKRVEVLEKVIQKWGKVLHPSNLLVVRLKYNLIGLYGRQPGYTQQEMNEQLWDRKRKLCEEVLETLKILEPGLTVRKARLLQELHLPLLMLAQTHLSQGCDKTSVKREFQRGAVTLGLVTRVFEKEPEGSWERETAVSNQATLLQVSQIVAGL